MNNGERARSLRKVRTTILEMLNDRGYDCSSYPIDIDEVEIIERFQQDTLDIFVPRREGNYKMYVRFYKIYSFDVKTFGKKELQQTVDDIRSNYPDDDIHFIILLHQEPTPPAKKALETDIERYKHVEVYQINRFVFNITKHRLVPKHRKMDENEVRELMEKYGCTRGQLPKIFSTDPVSQYYGFRSGDVIEITRYNIPTTGRSMYYRMVK